MGHIYPETQRLLIRQWEPADALMLYGIMANKASMRVMEKIGMSCLGLREFRGEQDMFYEITRERYGR